MKKLDDDAQQALDRLGEAGRRDFLKMMDISDRSIADQKRRRDDLILSLKLKQALSAQKRRVS